MLYTKLLNDYLNELNEQLTSDLLLDDLCLFIYETKDIGRVVRYELTLSSYQLHVEVPAEVIAISFNTIINVFTQKFLVMIDKHRHQHLYL